MILIDGTQQGSTIVATFTYYVEDSPRLTKHRSTLHFRISDASICKTAVVVILLAHLLSSVNSYSLSCTTLPC